MDKSVRAKLDDLLSHQSRCNFDDAESMAESLVDEFDETESSEWCYEITDAVQEWWDSQEEEVDSIAEDEERQAEEDDDEEFNRQLRRLDRKLKRRPNE